MKSSKESVIIWSGSFQRCRTGSAGISRRTELPLCFQLVEREISSHIPRRCPLTPMHKRMLENNYSNLLQRRDYRLERAFYIHGSFVQALFQIELQQREGCPLNMDPTLVQRKGIIRRTEEGRGKEMQRKLQKGPKSLLCQRNRSQRREKVSKEFHGE